MAVATENFTCVCVQCSIASATPFNTSVIAGVSGISGEISDSSAARILNSFGGSSSSVKVDPRLSEPARSVSTAGL